MIDYSGENEKNTELQDEKIKVIAITGRSGSGKSTVAKIFTAHNYTVLDADLAAKTAVAKGSDCIEKLSHAFGGDIVLESGELDKKLLAQRAFKTKEGAKTLTDITHPKIAQILNDGIEKAHQNGEKLVFVDGAVIIGGIFEKYCDEFIVVTTPENEAIERIILRDGITKELAEKRLGAQLTQAQMVQKANYVIENTNGEGETALEKRALFVLRSILSETK